MERSEIRGVRCHTAKQTRIPLRSMRATTARTGMLGRVAEVSCCGFNSRRLEALDQAGVDQKTVEPTDFAATITAIEQAVAPLKYLLLLFKGRRQWHTRSFLHNQGKIRCIEPVA